ncbi:hypothetical protein [uncultured Desulfobacter sp.]|uniref:hypothetical protein n=1 Tax=uncultured Desulfobacter sp. TaxID=240139 RepID=UPI002AAAEBBA|nr:hypothetical protein [uncultured Desulfobacter sp.]
MGQNILARLGYRVLDAQMPSLALELAHQHQNGLNLLITDVILPEMNGRELSNRIQSICLVLRHCSCPVIQPM